VPQHQGYKDKGPIRLLIASDLPVQDALRLAARRYGRRLIGAAAIAASEEWPAMADGFPFDSNGAVESGAPILVIALAVKLGKQLA
jgi:hypothetical protein